MIRLATLAAASLCLAWPAAAADRWDGPDVKVRFKAGPLAQGEMGRRTIAADQPFMIQRLTATGSVTLQSDVTVKFWHRTARFAQGAQLFQATGVEGFEVYCGAYDPGGLARSAGTYKNQYACLHDADGDGVFDKGYWTPNNPGSPLPVFGEVIAGPDIKVAYRPDAEADRFYFEAAVVMPRAGKGKSGVVFFRQVRLPGQDRWSPVVSVLAQSRRIVTEPRMIRVETGTLPQSVSIDGARFDLVALTSEGATIDPVAVETGLRTIDPFTAY